MFIVLCLPIVTAIYGGETWTYHFPYCNKLTVNITGTLPIETNEYTVLNDCTKNNNSYTCDCTDDYDFNVTFKTNTINNYTFDFNYDYSMEVVKAPAGGNSRTSSSGVFTVRFTNKTRTLMMKQFVYSRFWVDGEQHTIRIVEMGKDWIKLEIKSEPINITLNLNETKEIQIDNETLKLNLKEIRGRVAFIEFTKIEKIIKEETKKVEDIIANETVEKGGGGINLTETVETEEKDVELEPEKRPYIYLIKAIIILSVVIIGLLGYFVYKKRHSKAKRSKKEESL